MVVVTACDGNNDRKSTSLLETMTDYPLDRARHGMLMCSQVRDWRDTMKAHKSYMYRQGSGWIVAHWDEDRHCYRVGGEQPWGAARIAVGSANCPHADDGRCDKITHYHYKS